MKMLNSAVIFFQLKKNEKLDETHRIYENKLIFNNNNGKISVKLEKEDKITINDLIPQYIVNTVQKEFESYNLPILNSTLSSIPIKWNQFFKNNFNPKYALNSNLSKILNNDSERKKFLNLVNYMLPFIESVDITRYKDIFQITECYNNVSIPSYLVSDGTCNIISLIVNLYFEKSNIILIEEIERNIHPELLSKLVQMIDEASKTKQIIVTTHSPELLKYFDLNDIFSISRDENAFSVITKLNDNKLFI